jgi:hypothetical protein
MTTIFINRTDYGNPGDLWSSPFHYLDKSYQGMMLDCANLGGLPYIEQVDNIVVGGGSLLNNQKYIERIVKFLKNVKYKNLVVWGVGLNTELDTEIFRSAVLYGTREWLPETLYQDHWLPCASVLNPIFSHVQDKKPVKDFLVLDHWKRKPIEFHAEHTRICNNPATIENIVLEIANHRWVITSSYHTAYWAILCGKKVVVCSNPWQPKFKNFKHAPVLAEKFSWALLDDCQSYPAAYQECRDANLNFMKKFIDLANPQYNHSLHCQLS